MSFPLLQSTELLSQIQLALNSNNETRKKTASEVLQELIILSTECINYSNEIAIKFRDLTKHMIDEEKLLRDAAHLESLNRMKEYEQKIRDEAHKCKEETEHNETMHKLCEAAKKMRIEAQHLRDSTQNKSQVVTNKDDLLNK